MLQIAGWSLHAFILAGTAFAVNAKSSTLTIWITYIILSVFGLFWTHLFYKYYISKRIFVTNFSKLAKYIFGGAFVLSCLLVLSRIAMGALHDLVLIKFFKFNLLPQAGTSFPFLLSVTANAFGAMLIWSLLYFSFKFFEQYNGALVGQLKVEAALKEAQYQGLIAQINPHFLFNTLNAIRELTKIDASKAWSAVTELSDLLRYTLTSEKVRLVSLNEELTAIKDYLSIETMRFGNRLAYHLHVPEEIRSLQIPPVSLLTLVENAIKHGISKSVAGGKITICCKMVDGHLEAQVSNCGELAFNYSKGIGLSNLLRRMDILYGGDYFFSIVNERNRLVSATLKFPVHEIKNRID